MKSILINSSARTNGNSSIVLNYIAELLVNNDLERVDLNSLSIKMCNGCRLCFDKGEEACPQRDDLLELYTKMQRADLLIFTGPVYVEDVNGIMKNWIDRMGFNCHRPGLYKQNAYIILHSGGGASNHALKTMERALQTWGVRVLHKRKLILGAKVTKDSFIEKYGKHLQKDIDQVLEKLQRRNKPQFVQLLTFNIQKWYYNYRYNRDSFDFRHWDKNGWLDKKRGYYYDVKVNILAKTLINLLSNLIIKLVLR